MTFISTPNQLVRYAYGESPQLERFEVEFALEADSRHRRAYAELKKARRALSEVTVQPSRKVLDRILAYATSPTCEPHC